MTCRSCKGHGKVWSVPIAPRRSMRKTCPDCGGTGQQPEKFNILSLPIKEGLWIEPEEGK